MQKIKKNTCKPFDDKNNINHYSIVFSDTALYLVFYYLNCYCQS